MNWLNNNIASILDVLIVLGTLGLAFLVFGGFIPVEGVFKEIIFYIFGALMAIVTTVYGYHRGSSQGSKDKDKTITDITTEKEA